MLLLFFCILRKSKRMDFFELLIFPYASYCFPIESSIYNL